MNRTTSILSPDRPPSAPPSPRSLSLTAPAVTTQRVAQHLAELYTSCGNPNCRCANPDQRHGPYWQLTWKEAGKTVTRRLSADDAALYHEWIANRHQLEAVLEQMRDLSHQAGEQILASRDRPFHGPQRPRQRRRPAG